MGEHTVRAFLKDLLFPSRCPFCDRFIPFDRICCDECASDLDWADENICTGCGKSIFKDCLCGKVSYDMCITAAYYKDGARHGIHNMKFRSDPAAAEIFGRIIGDRLKVLCPDVQIGAAVPVPMPREQKRQRGYNQAELIAKAAVKGTDIPIITDALIRKNVRKSQHLLGAEDRAKAVGEQYFKGDIRLDGMTVLLVDDVLTTGSTLDRCAALLKEMGAERVICGVCCTV